MFLLCGVWRWRWLKSWPSFVSPFAYVTLLYVTCQIIHKWQVFPSICSPGLWSDCYTVYMSHLYVPSMCPCPAWPPGAELRCSHPHRQHCGHASLTELLINKHLLPTMPRSSADRLQAPEGTKSHHLAPQRVTQEDTVRKHSASYHSWIPLHLLPFTGGMLSAYSTLPAESSHRPESR